MQQFPQTVAAEKFENQTGILGRMESALGLRNDVKYSRIDMSCRPDFKGLCVRAAIFIAILS